MSASSAAPAATRDATGVAPGHITAVQPVAVTAGSPAQDAVFISEQEVLFGSSAAGALRPVAPVRQIGRAIYGFFAAIGRVFLADSDPVANRRRHVEPTYMEAARMAREMGRL